MNVQRLLLVLVCISGLSACYVRGKTEEEKRAERASRVVAPPVKEVEGLSDDWREGRLPEGLEDGEPVRGGTLTVRINGEPPSLGYMIESDFWLSRIAHHNINEALVRPDPRGHPDYPMIPELAESWTESDDHLTYTFKLRRGVKWHDGKPFTSRDVKFSFDRLMDPLVRALAKRSYFEDLESVTTPDEYTVVIRYERPFVWAVQRIGDIPIYPAHAFEGYEGAAFNTAPYMRAPIGTGPFRFHSWEDGKAITLERFDGYWGKKAWVDRVVYRIVNEDNVAQQLAMRGEIDIDTAMTSERYVLAAGEQKLVDQYHRVKYYESLYGWIGFNNQRPVFRDPRVRRALVQLLDRDRILEALYFNVPVEANCVFYHLGKGCDPDTKQPSYDPAAALALLEEAGWRDTDGDGILDKDGMPLRFTATIPSGSSSNEQLMLLYKQSLYRAGIEMELQKVEWSIYSNKLRNHEFDVCLLAWVSDAESDPYPVWHSSQADGGSNYIGFSDPKADAMAEHIRTVFDVEERQRLFREFNDYIVSQSPIALLFHNPRRTILHRRLRGVYLAPIEFFQVRDIWIDPNWSKS